MTDLKQLGRTLVEVSENEEFSAQRGVVETMFPYIFEASRRMSSRAISRWLESQGTKLSAVTVAKALRNADRYWESHWEQVEPYARRVAEAHNVSVVDLVSQQELFAALDGQPPTISGLTRESQLENLELYEEAVGRLGADWFGLSRFVREACLESVQPDREEKGEEPELPPKLTPDAP